jgi:hypothetical protein
MCFRPDNDQATAAKLAGLRQRRGAFPSAAAPAKVNRLGGREREPGRMKHDIHVTAPTPFVEANGIRFAYRRFGQERGTPLSRRIFGAGSIIRIPRSTTALRKIDRLFWSTTRGSPPEAARRWTPSIRWRSTPPILSGARIFANRSARLLNREIYRADPCDAPSRDDPSSHSRWHRPAGR